MPPKRKRNINNSEETAKKKRKTSPKSRKVTKNAKSSQKITKDKKPKKMNAKVTTITDAVSEQAAKSSSLELSALITDPGWKAALKDIFKENYFKQIERTLANDYNSGLQIFPPKNLIFNAFNATPIDKIKVVILGQDPYHDDGQAMGLSFSVPVGVKPPPSLKNIYKELTNDKDIKGFTSPDHGCLDEWTKEGVFLLNATLTVEAHKPNSHAKYGWQKFTDEVIKIINEKCSGVVFILWGNFAQKKEKLINESKHSVIKTAHPSPLSVNKFMGCKCFSHANNALIKKGKTPINWAL